MKTISSYDAGRDNNFNLLRFIAASCVVFSHAFSVVSGELTHEPLEVFTDYALGNHAVTLFFVVSGFLVTRSLVHSRDLVEYSLARALRLFPGLLVAGFLTVFVLGPLVTTLPLGSYFSSQSIWANIPVSMMLFGDKMTLPGVFELNAYADIVNIPLWTLRWEVFAYCAIAGLFAAGLLINRQRFAAVLCVFVTVYFSITVLTDWRESLFGVDHILRFLFCFLVGASMFTWRKQLYLSLPIAFALWLATWIFYSTSLYQPALIVAIGYSAMWFALVPGGPIRRFNQMGDYSYGVYIYGFPIKQAAIAILPALSVSGLLMFSFPVILLLAILSYHLVERPMLKLRKPMVARLKTSLSSAKLT